MQHSVKLLQQLFGILAGKFLMEEVTPPGSTFVEKLAVRKKTRALVTTAPNLDVTAADIGVRTTHSPKSVGFVYIHILDGPSNKLFYYGVEVP